MSMEKRAIIEDGRTPPETPEKQGEQLEDHLTKRAADAAKDCCEAKLPKAK